MIYGARLMQINTNFEYKYGSFDWLKDLFHQFTVDFSNEQALLCYCIALVNTCSKHVNHKKCNDSINQDSCRE